MKFKGTSILAKTFRARLKYEVSVKELEDWLRDKVDFDFAVDYQPADGIMIVDLESGINIAPAGECLSVIYRKGNLSREDHKKLCI